MSGAQAQLVEINSRDSGLGISIFNSSLGDINVKPEWRIKQLRN